MTQYTEAGVDIAAGDTFVESIKSIAAQTYGPQVLSGVGGFAALYELPRVCENTVLVSSTDGVGTKLQLAIEFSMTYNVGIDLVAMCVNDIICCGAKPLFFLDYFATGKLTENLELEKEFIRGVADGCKQAGMSLVGGETAEMPGTYHEKEIDAAGFCVGIVEKARIISPQTKWIIPGDVVIGLASSGPHANGFSLIRKVLDREFTNRADIITHVINPNTRLTVLHALMEPTKIYVNDIHRLLDTNVQVKGIAHITGGGLVENIPRALPNNVQVEIDKTLWGKAEVFDWLLNYNIELSEMYRVFNCGVGMVLIVSKDVYTSVLNILNSNDTIAQQIGVVSARQDKAQVTFVP